MVASSDRALERTRQNRCAAGRKRQTPGVTTKPAAVARSYDEIAERWSELEQSQYGIAQHERALAFLSSRGYALDTGCGGSGRFIGFLRRHSFQVEGVDISERMIALARDRHPAVTFCCADICEWKLPRQYEFISAWDSVWHVPLARQRPVLTKIMEALTPGGVLIFTTPGLDRPVEKVDSEMGPPMYYGGLGIPDTLKLLAETGCVCRHLEYDQYPELHLYLIAQKAG